MRLKFGKLAIAVKRAPNILVAGAIEHDTVAAMLEPQMRAWQGNAGQFFDHQFWLSNLDRV
jgi:hypothetical protein